MKQKILLLTGGVLILCLIITNFWWSSKETPKTSTVSSNKTITLTKDNPQAPLVPKPTVVTKPVVVSKYLTEAAVIPTGDLPKGFLGHDPEKIFSMFKIFQKPSKMEMETTREFEERVAQWDDKSFYGDVKRRDLLAISFPAQGIRTPKDVKYDADREMMLVSFSPSYAGDNGVLLFSHYADKKAYEAQNAFGIKATVIVSASEENYLEFSPKMPTYQLEIPVPRAEAVEVKESLRSVAFGKIQSENYFSKNSEHKKATIHDPFETNSTIFKLLFIADEIWFYSEKTGKVYEKKKVSYSQPKNAPKGKSGKQPRG